MTTQTADQGGIDPGAPFEPEAAGAFEDAPAAEPLKLAPTVTTSQVVKALTFATGQLHGVAGDRARCNLTMTRTEAELVAPGICRYVNARPAVARLVAAGGGDEYLRALAGVGLYGWRLTRERTAALQAEAEQYDEQAPIINGDHDPIGAPHADQF